MKNGVFKIIVSYFLLFPVVGFSQDRTDGDEVVGRDLQSSSRSEPQAKMPYEIVITPTIRRSDLRGLIQLVEEDFYDKFNELNLDDAYDIICYEYVPTMSHIPKRQCEPIFMIQARGRNASEAAFALASKYVDQQASAFVLSPRGLRTVKGGEYEILQEKMETFNRDNEEFRSIGSVLAQLKARLENFGKDD